MCLLLTFSIGCGREPNLLFLWDNEVDQYVYQYVSVHVYVHLWSFVMIYEGVFKSFKLCTHLCVCVCVLARCLGGIAFIEKRNILSLKKKKKNEYDKSER